MANKKYSKTIILLDSHAILHRAYHAMTDFATKAGKPTGALYGYLNLVIQMCHQYKPHMIVATFDLPKPTFRHTVYQGYKDGRAKTDDALVEQIIESKEMCLKLGIPVFEAEGFEADDILGTLANALVDEPDTQIVIASGDMDTLQLVVKDKVVVYTLKKGAESFVYDEKGVWDRFGFGPLQIPDYKGLAGDSSDNIIGIKGIGPKTATSIIEKYGTVEKMYEVLKEKGIDELVKNGLTPRLANLVAENEEEALFSKTLATIRRDAPVHLDISEKPYSQTLNVENFMNICDMYEFRSLKNKVNTIVALAVEEKKIELVVENDVLDRMRILANILHSEMTNASIQEIEELTDKHNVEEIFIWLQDAVKKEGLWNLYEDVELPVMDIVHEMNSSGVKVDVAALAELSKKLHIKVDELTIRIFELAGHEFTISSPKQLGVVLYDELGLGTKIKKTSTGARSTNSGELEKIKDDHEIVPLVMEFRELSKLLSTYIDSLPAYVKDDNRIHPTFMQTGAATGRFACTDPNLQNLPVKSEWGEGIRNAFVAGEGNVLLSLDYAQIDLRSAAILSKDPILVDIFERGIDVHTGTAASMFHKDASLISSDERRKAKAINFGILYGMGVSSLKEGMGVDRKEAQEFYDTYKSTFVTLMEYLEKVKRDAYSKGYTETLLGRRREIPLLTSSMPFMRASGERIAINAPVQGTSADIIKLAMIDINKWLRDNYTLDQAKLIMQIHDEVIYEVSDALEKEISLKMTKICEEVLAKRSLSNLPLRVSVSSGKKLGGV